MVSALRSARCLSGPFGHFSDDGPEKGFWTRVGTAWETKSGDGLNLVLNLIPAGNAGAVRITPLPRGKPTVTKPASDPEGGDASSCRLRPSSRTNARTTNQREKQQP